MATPSSAGLWFTVSPPGAAGPAHSCVPPLRDEADQVPWVRLSVEQSSGWRHLALGEGGPFDLLQTRNASRPAETPAGVPVESRYFQTKGRFPKIVEISKGRAGEPPSQEGWRFSAGPSGSPPGHPVQFLPSGSLHRAWPTTCHIGPQPLPGSHGSLAGHSISATL